MNTSRRPRHFVVLTTVLPKGERLPTLVHEGSWKPCRLALRWSVRYRRFHVQSSTLAHNLRVIAHVYEWARRLKEIGDLDDFVCAGGNLTSTMINAHTTLGRYRTDGARIRSTKQ